MIDEEIKETVEETPEVEETGKQENPEVDKTEDKETPVELDYSSYKNLGTPEEVKTYLADILPENPSKEEIEFAKKFLTKLNDDSEEKKEEKEDDDKVIEKNKQEVLGNLPISENDFKSLKIWVSNQPDDYKEKIAELTHWKNSPEDIRNAIIQANKDRLNSASGALRIDNNSNSGYTPLSKEEVKKEYENICMAYNGAERKIKVNELKSKAKAIPKLKEWAEYFF